MEDQAMESTKNGVIEFILTVNERHIVGHLYFEVKSRVWSFKYSDSFKSDRFLPMSDLPDLDKTYQGEELIKWLTNRIYDKVESDPMRFRLREYVKNKDNKLLSYFLEVSHVH